LRLTGPVLRIILMNPRHCCLAATLGLFVLLQACKHPLAIEGEGDIVDLNNSGPGCTLEQFQAGAFACIVN
jgi:hypothetical protein